MALAPADVAGEQKQNWASTREAGCISLDKESSGEFWLGCTCSRALSNAKVHLSSDETEHGAKTGMMQRCDPPLPAP